MVVLSLDGRVARRDRNRLAVVDSMFELFDEGNLQPTVEDVAARSGISERSIFRYFASRDDLRQEVMRRNFDKVSSLVEAADPERGRLDERIRWLVDARVDIWSAVAGAARAGRIRSPFSPDIAAEADRFRRLLDDQVRQYFKTELVSLRRSEADELVVLNDVLLSFEAWDLLVGPYAQKRPQVKRAWENTLFFNTRVSEFLPRGPDR
jgi:AcrR family transcriptional regulator